MNLTVPIEQRLLEAIRFLAPENRQADARYYSVCHLTEVQLTG